MTIFKTMAFFEDVADGTLFLVDTIEHEGKKWLVPEWLNNKAEGWRQPARIVLLDVFQHQVTTGSGAEDFFLNEPLSKAVLEGRDQPPTGSRYVVIERPNIRYPLPVTH